MTNPTSNFGWQMPTPTDLVTDLPADFEVFGQAVDTSLADLQGGTTGQILSKASNTDMDFTWITNDVGDITAVNVTAPITGGGTSGAVTIGVDAATTSAAGVVQLSDSTSTTSSVLASTPTATKSAYDLAAAAIAKSTVTTAGDIIYRNGSAPTRLGIGTAGQVLTVNSGATAPEWATATSGGLTSIASGSLTGASVVINSIAGTYKNLQLVLRDYYMSTSATFSLKVNAIANYNLIRDLVNASTVTRDGLTGNGNFPLAYNNIATSDNDSATTVNIYDYASSVNKNINALMSYTNTSAAKDFMNYNGNAVMNAAVTSITLTTSAGNFSGGTYILYGVN